MAEEGALRVLVVEDEGVVSLDIRNRLKRMGMQVVGQADSGEEAVRLAVEQTPDLVLMDIMLAGEMDGIEAASRIRDSVGTPVIFLTAYADEATLDRAKISTPFGYIVKPFEDRELAINIEMALYKYKMDRRLRDNERWLDTTLRSIGDGVITTDQDGRVTFVNPEALRILGQDGEEWLGQKLDGVLRLTSEETGEPVRDMAGRVLRGEEACCSSDNMLLFPPVGEPAPVNITISPIRRGREGDVMGAVLVIRDISERKHSEQELRAYVRRLKTTLEQTVNALAITSEKRDPYTAGHQQRVAQLACAMAKELGLDEDKVEGIRVAALLHDIGKIYVPAEILSKPARLTNMEMGIVKTHPEVGYDILKEVPFPWPVAEIVLQHHERVDGSGYPSGLRRQDILPEARILCVADVVEAMSSHRPYRAALGPDLALKEITKNRGHLYDSELVDVCISLFNDGFNFKQFD
ncbi:HD domain-containing phosphohydrolase [Desulfohalovibrio reitneri]|uniref:HD domain-containing phosphohydrolase n=1 Tax=Desulfohalovibrio reitneri TaxID=1307759 RepID=UPI0004A6A8D8|nr:HD domain-containing phosphohydrolase [Desulfohalovibrio reitneri]